MLRTPLVLEVLMHCHVSPEPHLYMHREVYRAARDTLINNQLIAVTKKHNDFDKYVFSTTERGKFFIEHLLNTPFPQVREQYYIPEEQEK